MPACAKCGADTGPERWKTLCRRCFARQRDAEEEASLQAQLTKALEEAAALRAALRQMITEAGRKAVISERLPADKVRLLLQLCHPDKHNGSKAAEEATRWLLEQKR